MLRASLAFLLSWPALASAQPPEAAARSVPAQAQAQAGGALDSAAAVEEPDATRLDAERLPPEAIQVTRALYAHGFFLEAMLGGRGFVGGVGRLSSPGPVLSVSFGYELFDWLWVRALSEISMHETSAPAPPSRAVFELLSSSLAVKVQGSPTPELGLWFEGQVGLVVASTDILAQYGLRDASTVGLLWGADLGVDAHFHSRHYSIGLCGGVRGAPSLDGVSGEVALGVQASAYLRYVL